MIFVIVILYFGLVLSLQELYYVSILYPLYYLPKDGHMNDRNMQEVIVYKTISLVCILLVLLLHSVTYIGVTSCVFQHCNFRD
jgi:hypothetical protein